ncbi:PREDICTED: tetratricopeptide repeat protein 7B-like [Tarenaya hassleriana]|uniref:tetratricopeptide repeat protein 7B-like n=1 Tax=Tarenaya hassleriana TaxID=28532 RepID=UPI00053C994A|nr:PREDICTED: tetratricopeptide repeat protein 7B-like [Tarenaya hassleriana]XP_010532676.1 PREDICTED: tetratricopeptide repeat protein 7B-like [Tarenaya hassleriana]XP_010532677.1 PREDICTED: tetratricopeptide repeat protein 7B-like [Tarenaya hassleriana]XP_010532678.1 PREDICTED: tetratricopeptide repeat protein 7B-like [Tarenaya hassleriana]
MSLKNWIDSKSSEIKSKLQKMMKCIWSGQQLAMDEATADSSDSLATRDYSASGFSSKTGETAFVSKTDETNIEEAESSLRESGFLNYEEARALLGRLEYQKGNVEAALHVYEGIDIVSVMSKIKHSLSRRSVPTNRHLQSDVSSQMSLHAISLLLEAVFFKAKSLQHLGRFDEAVRFCRVILDTVESALPEGFSEALASDLKLNRTLNRAVELFPELCKLAGASSDVILAYRRALLYRWNLDAETTGKIHKEFAVFLLYGGVDWKPPNLRCQIEDSFVPQNNVEEAILLLLVLLRKSTLRRISWDPSVMDHLSYALAILGESRVLALQVEDLHPGFVSRKEALYTSALCYYAEGQNIVALNLLRNLLDEKERHGCLLELLLASKICGENSIYISDGLSYAGEAVSKTDDEMCSQMISVANCLRAVLLSAEARSAVSDMDRSLGQSQALDALETAEKVMTERNPYVIFRLCLENAEQRKLEVALHYAKQLLQIESGSDVKGYIVLARILSSQKRYSEAEAVIDAAMDQTTKWEQHELLKTKAKLEEAQGRLKNAIRTYTRLLAILQIRHRSLSIEKGREKQDKRMEAETWLDLANVYTSLVSWTDAELCLLKSKAIEPYSANRWHSIGLLNEAKGLKPEALKSYNTALDIEPTHIQSLTSAARVLLQLCRCSQCLPVLRSLLTDAIRLDRTNHAAWYNLGLVYGADPCAPDGDAAECFRAAVVLEETSPVEPFR